MHANQSAYKSEKAKEQALKSYDNLLSHWPVFYQTRIVNMQDIFNISLRA